MVRSIAYPCSNSISHQTSNPSHSPLPPRCCSQCFPCTGDQPSGGPCARDGWLNHHALKPLQKPEASGSKHLVRKKSFDKFWCKPSSQHWTIHLFNKKTWVKNFPMKPAMWNSQSSMLTEFQIIFIAKIAEMWRKPSSEIARVAGWKPNGPWAGDPRAERGFRNGPAGVLEEPWAAQWCADLAYPIVLFPTKMGSLWREISV